MLLGMYLCAMHSYCVVDCLVTEVHSLKSSKMTAGMNQGVVSDEQLGGLNRDVNFFGDGIVNELGKVASCGVELHISVFFEIA